MTTPQEQRRIRMASDYQEMLSIKGNLVDWRPIVGTAPYVEKYELTVNVRTILDSRPTYRDSHIITVTLLPNYPRVAPQIVMQSSPGPYHPNWFAEKRWCYGSWVISEGLGHHIVRMIRTLQFDPEITNPESPANRGATEWYLKNRNRGWFPCDRQMLPDPTGKTKKKFEMKSPSKKTFRIE